MNEPSDIPEAVNAAIEFAVNAVPFGRWLGLELSGIEGDRVHMAFDMRDELVGNPALQVLHGGVTSAVLDTVGGLAAMLGILTRAANDPDGGGASPWLSTIDLRTDFLRPGLGKRFTTTGFPLRVGGRLVVTRMELHNESADLIAVGTGSYFIP